jgi:hypothetical protein
MLERPSAANCAGFAIGCGEADERGDMSGKARRTPAGAATITSLTFLHRPARPLQ